jgi:hypothetical protein
MSYLDSIRFTGELRKGDLTIQVAFEAEIDDTGTLQLRFDELPATAETIWISIDGDEVEWLTLAGTAATGETFASDTFSVDGYTHHSDAEGSRILMHGNCAEAKLHRTFSSPQTVSAVSMRFPRFHSFSWLLREIDLGKVRMGGAEESPMQPQKLTAELMLHRDGKADEAWFEAAKARLTHILRVMSFASGVYLRPKIVRRVVGTDDQFIIYDHSGTPEPFLPPFHFLNLEPIFATACDADAAVRTGFEALDPAVRWLLAPGYYDEMRLMTAMTALENMVEHAFPGHQGLFAKPSAFKKIAKAVRDLLSAQKAPQEMINKVPELNRIPFAAKLQSYLQARGVAVSDLKPDAIEAMIRARNFVVHRGIYFDPDAADQADIWDHMLLARELVTRACLAELRFVGNYFSRLYGVNQQLRFPSCRQLTDKHGVEIPI